MDQKRLKMVIKSQMFFDKLKSNKPTSSQLVKKSKSQLKAYAAKYVNPQRRPPSKQEVNKIKTEKMEIEFK